MKRAAVFLLTLCLLIFAGCSPGQRQLKAEDINLVFSCKADITTPDGKFTCAVERAGLQSASVEILSGSGAGLKWYWNGDAFRQTYRGLNAESPACVLPEQSFASALVEAFDCAQQPGALERVDGNVFSGSMKDGTFTVSADGGTGNVTELSVPGRNLTASFHDFTEPAFELAFRTGA